MTTTTSALEVMRRIPSGFSRPYALLYTLVLFVQLSIATASAGTALDRVIQLEIPANTSLEDALIAWGVKADITVMTNTATVIHHTTPGVSGTFSARSALSMILRDSGLSYTEDGATVRIVPNNTSVRLSSHDIKLAASVSANSDVVGQGSGDDTDQGNLSADTTSDSNRSRKGDLEQVVVTAQKREEKLQDVPVPVTAISAQNLVDNNQVTLQDFYATVPGLSLTASSNTGSSQVAIRGISGSAQQGPTVATTIDDVPFGSSSALAFGWDVPDLDPSELSRIEVLRGPQGTLYGASSLGGLIKYVTVDPSTTALSGHIDVGTDTIQNAPNVGYSVRAGVNVPISDTFAIRASGYERFEPGYIDNIETDQRGVNKEQRGGGRIAVLWKASDAVTVKVSAILEHSYRYGSPFVDIVAPDPTFAQNLGDLDQSAVRGTGFLDKNFQAYNATLTAKVGGFDITSVTGYSLSKNENSWDLTGALDTVVQQDFGVPGDPDNSDLADKKFTEELRVSGQIGARTDWLVGGFFDHDSGNENQYLLAAVPTTGAVVGTLLHDIDPSTYQEEAVFIDLTYHFTDRFDVQVGGREGRIRQSYQETFIGPYDDLIGESSPYLFPLIHSKETPFTYLFTPRFKLSPDVMVYARVASGYRPGGPNIDATPFGLPATYNHDSTKNYDIGLKGDVLNHMVSLDASLYYIDWSGIQLTVSNPEGAGSAQTNGSRAKSDGVELSATAKPLSGLTVDAWVTFTDAVLTESFPPTAALFGASGDRLPFISRFSGNISFTENIHLSNKTTGFVGATLSYVGDRLGGFASEANGPRQYYPAYAKTDLRSGVRYDSWTVNVYANNVANKRAALLGGLDSSPVDDFVYIQPRTVGVTLSKVF